MNDTKNVQLSEVAIQADEFSWKRLGSLPGCLAIESADIGEAYIEGERVIITWGRNLTKQQQGWFATYTVFRPIHLGAWNGECELILPEDVANSLLTLLR